VNPVDYEINETESYVNFYLKNDNKMKDNSSEIENTNEENQTENNLVQPNICSMSSMQSYTTSFGSFEQTKE
jgi:hypothetical protein